MKQKFLRIVSKVLMFLTASTVVVSAVAPMAANAATIVTGIVVQERLQISTTGHMIISFSTPSGIGASDGSETVIVTFQDSHTLTSLGVNDVDFEHKTGATSCDSPEDTWTSPTTETVAASASATDWGFATSATAITFTAPSDGVGSAAIVANDCIRIEIGAVATTGATGTDRITNPGTTGSKRISISGTFGDSGDMAVGIVDDDQLTATGTVNASLTFFIDNTTATSSGTIAAGGGAGCGLSSSYDSTLGNVAFGTISTSAVASSIASSVNAICVRTSTNAGNGVTVYVVDTNVGLKSTSQTGDIIDSPAASDTGSIGFEDLVSGSSSVEGFGLCIANYNIDSTTPAGGTVDIAGTGNRFTNNATLAAATNNSACSADGTLSASRHVVGGLSALASTGIPTSSQVLFNVNNAVQGAYAEVRAKAGITSTTPAHDDYTDTIQFFAVASF